MSVTFFTPDTEYDEIAHEDKVYGDWIEKIPKEGYTEINMSNSNTYEFMDFIGRSHDIESGAGSWSRADLLKILPILIKITNTSKIDDFQKETIVVNNMVYCGRNADYVKMRVNQMISLVKGAIDRGTVVHFG
jgi:hypothetical protein